MYIETNLRSSSSPQFTAAVEAAEERINAPIRVLNGRGRGGLDLAATPWAPEHYGNDESWTAEWATERGVTFVAYGAANRTSYVGCSYFPVEASLDGQAIGAPLYDVLRQRYGNERDMAVTERGGYVMVEYAPRVVYDFWGTYACHADNFDWLALVTEPLIDCAAEDFVERQEQRRTEMMRQRVTEYFNSVPERSLQQVRSQIGQYESSLNNNRQAITNSLRELTRLQAQADALLATQLRSADEHMAEFDKLVNHPRAQRVEFTGDATITILTDDLVMHHPLNSESRWLGPFKLHIDTAGQYVSVENLHTARQGRAHPHAPDGEPCFGNLSAVIGETIAHGELWATFELLLQWAESFNPRDDYGRYASLWFDVEDARPTEDGDMALVGAANNAAEDIYMDEDDD